MWTGQLGDCGQQLFILSESGVPFTSLLPHHTPATIPWSDSTTARGQVKKQQLPLLPFCSLKSTCSDWSVSPLISMSACYHIQVRKIWPSPTTCGSFPWFSGTYWPAVPSQDHFQPRLRDSGYSTDGKHKAQELNMALHLVLFGPAPCFYPVAVRSSLPLVKEQLHLWSPKITFGPLKATTRLMWPPVKMSLTPLCYRLSQILNIPHRHAFSGYKPLKNPKTPGWEAKI